MNRRQLKHYQEAVRKLNKALEPVFTHWEDPMTEIISVLLQNMGADTTGCHGHTTEGAYKRVTTAKAAVLSLCKYNSFHVTEFIVEQLDFIERECYHLEELNDD